MIIKAIRSDSVYKKIMNAPAEKKNDIYRYEMMMPFKQKWDYCHIPLKAEKPSGFDIIMASRMLGFFEPQKLDTTQEDIVSQLSDDALWNACEKAIKTSLDCFTEAGIGLPVQEYLFTILLANPENPYTVMNKGYCGDGGIPGYIFAWLTPNEYTMSRLPAAMAHETNHNVRFQFIKWRNDITLGEMMVSEGLAENFATSLYGEDSAGPWVAETTMETLNGYIKPLMREALGIQGLNEMNAYLYGDEMALLQGSEPAGMPYCAGYACGYHLVKHYLKKTGKSVVEATLLPAEEILGEAQDFWNV